MPKLIGWAYVIQLPKQSETMTASEGDEAEENALWKCPVADWGTEGTIILMAATKCPTCSNGPKEDDTPTAVVRIRPQRW